jgi:hypothetical protein
MLAATDGDGDDGGDGGGSWCITGAPRRDEMMQPGRQAWWSAVKSGACAAMMFAAAACGGGGVESSRTPAGTGTPPQSQADGPAKVTEKPFASGGKIEMQLNAGDYTVRPGDGDAVRVTLGGNMGTAKVDITTGGTQANVSVKETPHNNFQATIEVPRSADLVIRLSAGDLKVEAIGGSKDIESNAGNVDIVTGDSKDYASVEASVKAGDINADVFGESQSGLFRSFTWSGQGKYTLRARLLAGNLTLRAK